MRRAAPRRSKASIVVAIVAACAAVACGTLLSIKNDDQLPTAEAGAPDGADDGLAETEAAPDAARDAADDARAAGDASECESKAPGTKCGGDGGNVCLADGGCQGCITNGVGTCVSSAECCDGHCSAFTSATFGSCTGVTGCVLLTENCQNTPCCLPYTCNPSVNRCQ